MNISFRETYWKITKRRENHNVRSVDREMMSTWILHDFIKLMISYSFSSKYVNSISCLSDCRNEEFFPLWICRLLLTSILLFWSKVISEETNLEGPTRLFSSTLNLFLTFIAIPMQIPRKSPRCYVFIHRNTQILIIIIEPNRRILSLRIQTSLLLCLLMIVSSWNEAREILFWHSIVIVRTGFDWMISDEEKKLLISIPQRNICLSLGRWDK